MKPFQHIIQDTPTSLFLTMCKSPFSSSLFSTDGPVSYGSVCGLHQLNNDYASPSFAEVDPQLPNNLWMSDDDTTSENKQEPRFSIFSLQGLSVGKLSIIILAFATLTDMVLTKMTTDVNLPRTSLGSAAISSVTDTLSPILPFAGGLDLRRDDYWSTSDGNWLGTLQSVASQVKDAFARKEELQKLKTIPRGGSGASGKVSRSLERTLKQQMAISVQQPFVSLDTISQLTLGEVGETFRYAAESSNSDFNESKFFQGLEPRVKKVIQAMKEAIARSRGRDFVNWVRAKDGSDEEVDALKFSGAMRIFAEWRLLRQVPEGYKGFAVGMSLGHKDVVQNIVKMEEAVHGWLDNQRELCDNGETCYPLHTPTLRQLLTYEVETGVHLADRLPRLKEKSAGMGLLWVRRQMAYQTQIFDNVLDMEHFASMKDAVGAAYKQVYDKYHGWAVQKIFNYSFQSAPEAEEILRHMNPHRLQELMDEQPGHEKVASDFHKDENPVAQLLNHIGSEWDKLAFNVAKVFNKDARGPKIQLRGGGGEPTLSRDEDYITREMVRDAHEQITAYLEVAKPLLRNLSTLFDDLNMDDPMRV